MTSTSFLGADNYLRACRPVLAFEALAPERIVITGASGFIGTNLREFGQVDV